MTTGQRIAEQRKKCGYSQIYVADKLNVSRQAVSRWEMDAAAPDTYNLIALAELLGVTVEYITLGRDTAPTVTEAAAVTQKRGMGLLNIILIPLAIWIGAGILLFFAFSLRKAWVWSELEVLILLCLVITPLPFAIMGRRGGISSAKSIFLCYLAGFGVALIVSGVNFLLEFMYIISEHSFSVFAFHSWDGGGAYSFMFLGLTLIQMSVMMPICLTRKINMLARILIVVLSAPVVIFLGSGVTELPGFGLYYINRWWTAICGVLYCAVALTHCLAVKKHAKNLDTEVGNRV